MSNQQPASGDQYELECGDFRATIASVGASLRSFTIGTRDLVAPFDADEVRPAFRGLTVAPWPNRVVDGRFTWNGADYQLPITEVGRGHALHGLTSWLQFTPEAQNETSVTLLAAVEPQLGYPWRILLETRFSLAENGLTQTVTATNLSDDAAPYGVCPHPYLVAEDGRVDDWTLQHPASQVLLVSEPRLVNESVESVEVDAARFDFREPRRIGDAKIDHAFTGLARDASGEARVEVRAENGRGVAMVWGDSCDWLQIHTADLPDVPEEENRIGLAVEPQTCAPDAFNTGADGGLVSLEPGGVHTASWRIEPIR